MARAFFFLYQPSDPCLWSLTCHMLNCIFKCISELSTCSPVFRFPAFCCGHPSFRGSLDLDCQQHYLSVKTSNGSVPWMLTLVNGGYLLAAITEYPQWDLPAAWLNSDSFCSERGGGERRVRACPCQCVWWAVAYELPFSLLRAGLRASPEWNYNKRGLNWHLPW